MLKKLLALTFIAAASIGGPLIAQEDSRQAEIAAGQDQKAADPKPVQQNKVERALIRFKEGTFLGRFSNGLGGFRLKAGGLAPGTGFGIGPEYRRNGLLGGELDFHASAQASFRGAQKFDLGLTAPKISGGRFFADFYAVHHDYPILSYYGPGADSQKTGRTDFRLEDTAVDATFGVRPINHLTLAASAGYLFNNVGPGTDSRYASADQTYSPAQAPGIDVQSNYLRVGGFAQYDWRDNASGPRRGGNYFAQFSDYRDRTFGLSNFRRLDVEAQQYVSVLNQRRVFALRAKSTLTFRDGAQPIPFYMQPTLGGSEDLRGYRPFRFRDDNLLAMNAEYRWEVFSGLDMAVFGDAGKVFANKSEFSLRHLESDAGFGFRFNARNQTFLRLDVGFSHEGFQVWVKFNNIFKKGPVHTSSTMGDF
jgi:outer membrane protein assembly factor BamA